MSPPAISPPSAQRKYSILAICLISLVFLVYVFDRVVVPVELVEIRAEYGLSLADAGLLASVFTLGLTVMAIPSGVIAMRYGARAALTLGVIIFSLCTAWTALGTGLGSMIAARIGGGVGEGLYNVSLLGFLGRMTGKYRAAAAGLPSSLFGIGVFLGPMVITSLFALTGNWRSPFFILTGAGLVGALGIWLVLGKAEIQPIAEARVPITWGRIRAVLVPGNIAVCFAIGVNGMAVYSFISLSQVYLRTGLGLPLTTASLIFSCFGFGQILGGLPMGYVADLVGRKKFFVTMALIIGAAGTAVFAVPPVTLLLCVLCFCFGIGTNSFYVNCIALMQDQVEREEIPLATGVLATVYYFTAAFSGYLFAVIRDAVGWTMSGLVAYGIPYLLAIAVVLYFVRYTSRNYDFEQTSVVKE